MSATSVALAPSGECLRGEGFEHIHLCCSMFGACMYVCVYAYVCMWISWFVFLPEMVNKVEYTYDCYMKNLVQSPPGFYPPRAGGKKTLAGWGGGVFATAPWVQLSVIAGNGWPHTARQHH